MYPRLIVEKLRRTYQSRCAGLQDPERRLGRSAEEAGTTGRRTTEHRHL